MRSMWKVEVRRSPETEAHFQTFVRWVRKTTNGGTDGTVSLYEKYDKDHYKDHQEQKNRPEDRSRQDPKDYSNNSRCYC